jgi:hypothetical protein
MEVGKLEKFNNLPLFTFLYRTPFLRVNNKTTYRI